MEFLDVLLEYFNLFRFCANKLGEDNKDIKFFDKIINIIDEVKNGGKVQYIDEMEFKHIKNTLPKYDISSHLDEFIKNTYNTSKEDSSLSGVTNTVINNVSRGIDFVMYDIMFNLNKYNLYLMNKKVKSQDIPINSDITFYNLDVKLKDILNYLEVNIDEVDSNLLSDISKYANLKSFKEMAITLKTDNGLKRVMFDKIEDKNVLLSILLHSNMESINSVLNIFESESVNVNKAIGIPSIFIKDVISSKCKYNCVICNYDNFVSNYNLMKKYGIDFKKMLNYPVYFINDSKVNESLFAKLENIGINPKNIFMYIGGKFVTNPNLVFENIQVLKQYNIELTDDNNNNGYTIIGMNNLAEVIDFFLEKDVFNSNYDGLDKIDLIRGLTIKKGYNNYLSCKDKAFYGKINIASSKSDKFSDENLSDERINSFFDNHNSIKDTVSLLDSKYLVDNITYSFGVNRVSRNRLLRNLCNYKGKGNDDILFRDALEYKSNTANLNEVEKLIMPLLEMGEESVKLSQRV